MLRFTTHRLSRANARGIALISGAMQHKAPRALRGKDTHRMKPVPIPPPSTAHKLKRLVWQAVWLLLYRPSPVPLHGWRRFLLRAFGAQVAGDAHPYPSAKVWAPWNLTMRAQRCLGPHSECYNACMVTLGKRAIVSQHAYLCTPSHETDDAFTLIGAPIVLENCAWVAAKAMVGPGVTVGRGAVVGAGAVAMKDVAAGKVVVGNPAREVSESELGASNGAVIRQADQ